VGQRRAAKRDVSKSVELDVPRVAAPPRDESLVFEPARAPTDVWRHANYNNSSLVTHSAKGG
jgi:hypothetical protein